MPAAEVLPALADLGLDLRSWEPWPYATSHSLTSLVVARSDGREERLLHKRLDTGGVLPAAVGKRPDHVVEGRREIDAYREVLPRLSGPPACVAGSVEELWLLLEHVDGPVLWQIGELGPWLDAARWLATAHRTLAADTCTPPASFIRYDEAYYQRWSDRALAFEGAGERRRRLLALAGSYRRAVHDLLDLPSTVVHGECYPSNIVVAGPAGAARVCLLDWEMAGVGPGSVDLAALLTGWSPHQRQALISAYAGAAGREAGAVAAEVDRAELHLCMRWLGWAPRWTPPAEHARDWLARGLELAEELGR